MSPNIFPLLCEVHWSVTHSASYRYMTYLPTGMGAEVAMCWFGAEAWRRSWCRESTCSSPISRQEWFLQSGTRSGKTHAPDPQQLNHLRKEMFLRKHWNLKEKRLFTPISCRYYLSLFYTLPPIKPKYRDVFWQAVCTNNFGHLCNMIQVTWYRYMVQVRSTWLAAWERDPGTTWTISTD